MANASPPTHKLFYRCLLFMLMSQPVVGSAQSPSTPLTDDPVPATPVTEETRDRETNTGEDPLAAQTTENEKTPEAAYKYIDHTSANLYGSARIRYKETGQGNNVDDAGSRVGFNGELQFTPAFWLLSRAEIGFNLFDSLDQLFNASGRPAEEDANISTRLLYGGIQTPSSSIIFGKNWSSYYQVAGFTDRFEAFGGEASGAFNAQTDGGATGTGRADRVLQGRFSIDDLTENSHLKPFKFNIQAQGEEDIPGLDNVQYTHSLGISALLEFKTEKVIGLAYNHAFVNDNDRAALRAGGIRGDARALLIGTRRFADRYYLGTTLSFLDNHETTDKGVYFDGWGWEFFGSYNIRKRWWLLGGWNNLQPHSDQWQAGQYRLRYGVVGLRYSFETLHRFVYSEIRLDDSLNSDGSRPGNIYTLGLRWDIR